MQNIIQLPHKPANAYVIPLGALNLVFITTDIGMVGCGAFDVEALQKFSYPAVRVKSASGAPIAAIGDLLQGIVKDANLAAQQLGITAGMSASDALARL